MSKVFGLLLVLFLTTTAFSQGNVTEKQLETMYDEGVFAAKEVNSLATLPLRQQLNDFRSFDEQEPKLKEVPKNKNQTAYQNEVRKAKALHKDQLEAFQKRKEQFESTIGDKRAKLTKELEKREAESVPWVFPSINLLRVKEDQIGIFGVQYIDEDYGLKTKYWLIEFWSKRGENGSEFWTAKNTVLAIAGLPSNKFAKSERYPIGKPVVHVATTDPERYLQYRVLTNDELKQIKTYVEKRSGKKISSDIFND